MVCNKNVFFYRKSQVKPIFSKEELEEFESLQPKVIADITSIDPYNKLPFLTSRIKSMLEYNLNGEAISSGTNAINVFKVVSNPEDRTSENMKQAILLGWCLKFVRIIFI